MLRNVAKKSPLTWMTKLTEERIDELVLVLGGQLRQDFGHPEQGFTDLRPDLDADVAGVVLVVEVSELGRQAVDHLQSNKFKSFQ